MDIVLLVGLPGSAIKKKQVNKYLERGYTQLEEFEQPPYTGDKLLDTNPWLCCKSILGRTLSLYKQAYPDSSTHVRYCPDDTPDEVPYFTKMLKERYEVPETSIVKTDDKDR